MGRLQHQKQAELAQILSPQELEQYLYHASPAADYVRKNLPEAKSEAEFRAIVRLAADLEMDANAATGSRARFGVEPADPTLAEAAAAKEAEFKRRLGDVLGQERVAEREAQRLADAEREQRETAQRQEQEERARLAAIAESVGVSVDDANRLLDQLEDQQPVWEARFKELEATLSGSPQEKATQMEAAVRAELEEQAVAIMGDKGRDFVRKAFRGSEP